MVLTSNLLTQTRSDIKTDLQALFTHGAIGTDNTPATAGDTALGAEVFRDSIDDFDTSQADKITASIIVLTTEANGNSIAEAGWLNQATGGTLWSRNVLTAINKTDDVQLFLDTEITIEVTEG